MNNKKNGMVLGKTKTNQPNKQKNPQIFAIYSDYLKMLINLFWKSLNKGKGRPFCRTQEKA